MSPTKIGQSHLKFNGCADMAGAMARLFNLVTNTAPHLTHIAPDKRTSIEEHDKITMGTKIYTDGSGIHGKIRASAIHYRRNGDTRAICYHLGWKDEHTVYKAESLVLTMAAHLLYTERDIETPVNIFVDSQAAIKSSDVFTTKSGHYLIDQFHRTLRFAIKKHSLIIVM